VAPAAIAAAVAALVLLYAALELAEVVKVQQGHQLDALVAVALQQHVQLAHGPLRSD
jgi:hypothetical protein